MIPFGLPQFVFTAGTHGITPAEISIAGNADSPLLNDVDPGDTTTELLWVLLSPLVASGTTLVDDLGGYALVGAADGVWSQPYRLLAMPQAGAAYVGTSYITTIVGSTTPTTRTVTLPLFDKPDGGEVVPDGGSIKYAFYESLDPQTWAAPLQTGVVDVIAGQITIELPTTSLGSGSLGFLVLTNNNGTLSPVPSGFAAPVLVS